jgi:nucleolar protein 4
LRSRPRRPAATSVDLTTHFSDIGPVRSSFVVLSSKPNPADPTAEPIKTSKGVGYVTFAMRTDAERAIAELNGRGFGGSKRKLGVEWADRKREEGEEPIVREKKRRIATQTSISVDDGPSTSAAAGSSAAAGGDPLAIRTIVISNLPAGLNKATLWKKIRKLSYNLSPSSLRFPLEGAAASETTAEVVFPTPKEAIENAERMHASTYKDSLLSCVLKKRLEKVAAPGSEGVGGEISKSGRMIIRNLPWDVRTCSCGACFYARRPPALTRTSLLGLTSRQLRLLLTGSSSLTAPSTPSRFRRRSSRRAPSRAREASPSSTC